MPQEALGMVETKGLVAMIGHQERVMVFHERTHRLGQLVGRRSSVGREWYASECQNHFGEYRLIDCQPGDSESRPVGWMCMANRLYVAPLPID